MIVTATDEIIRKDLITNVHCVNEIRHTELEKTSTIGEHSTFVKTPEEKRGKKCFFHEFIILSY